MRSFGSKSKLSACSLFPGFTCDLCDDVFMPFGLLNSQKKTCMNLKLVSAKLYAIDMILQITIQNSVLYRYMIFVF